MSIYENMCLKETHNMSIKISYVIPIEEAELSSKEKPSKHSRGRNFNCIVFKFHTHVGQIKIQYIPKKKLWFTIEGVILIRLSPNSV